MLRYIYFVYVTMSRLTTIVALLLCSQKSNAQVNSQVNNANIRHDPVLNGLYGNMGTMNLMDSSNQNMAINSNPLNTPSFKSKNGQNSLSYPHHFSFQSSSFPQSINPAISSPQITGLQPSLQSSSSVTSPNLKSFNLQDILSSQNIAQEQNLNSNLQFSPSQLSHLTSISIPGGSSDFVGEQTNTADIGYNSNIPASITVSQSIPSTYPATASIFSLPIPLQLGSMLQEQQSPMSVIGNVNDSPFSNYFTSFDSPLSAYVEKPKPSIWKELLPLILNVLKENRRSCGCCRCKCCGENKNGKVNEPQVYGGYSKEKRYGQSGEENNEFEVERFTKKTYTTARGEDDDQHDEGSEEVESESDDEW